MAKPLHLLPREMAGRVLHEDFDADMVNAFFSGNGKSASARGQSDSMTRATDALQNADAAAIAGLSDLAQPLKDESGDDHSPHGHSLGKASSALQDADELAEADLGPHAKPLDSDWLSQFITRGPETADSDTSETDGEAEFFDSADAKPSSKGGGKPDKEDGSGGKGRGKIKDTQPEEPVSEEPAPEEPAPEEPVTVEPAPEEPAPEEPVAEEPEPPTGEINPGTTTGNTYISGMDTPEGYNLELVFHGDWSAEMKAGFMNAAEDISDIITHDVSSYGDIDDFRLNLHTGYIDGGGGTLANAGWMQLRDGPDKLVAEGGALVETADIQSMMDKGIYEDMAFHETLHAMGFGTTWTYTGLVEESADGTRFIGTNAIEAYSTTTAAESDSLSDEGVPLSRDDAHWNQNKLGSEIMSPTLNYNENILSDLTNAALEDMGYETIYGDEEEAPADDMWLF